MAAPIVEAPQWAPAKMRVDDQTSNGNYRSKFDIGTYIGDDKPLTDVPFTELVYASMRWGVDFNWSSQAEVKGYMAHIGYIAKKAMAGLYVSDAMITYDDTIRKAAHLQGTCVFLNYNTDLTHGWSKHLNTEQTYTQTDIEQEPQIVHECIFCDKDFSTSIGLQEHLSIHVDYTCDYLPTSKDGLPKSVKEHSLCTPEVPEEADTADSQHSIETSKDMDLPSSLKKVDLPRSLETPEEACRADLPHSVERPEEPGMILLVPSAPEEADKSVNPPHSAQAHKGYDCDKQSNRANSLKTDIMHLIGGKPQGEQRIEDNMELNQHTVIHTGQDYSRCATCVRGFPHTADLLGHLDSHVIIPALLFDTVTASRTNSSGSADVETSVCQFGTESKAVMCVKRHQPYQCTECGEVFTQVSNLKKHMTRHTSNTKDCFQCARCNETFSDGLHLRTHVRSHTREKSHRCSHCDKTFTQAGNLKKHMMIHTGEKPYKCSHCDKHFTWASSLKTHLRTHTGGEKPYSCTMCSKSFTWPCSLKTHMVTHTGERRHKCSKCSKLFTLASNLRKHMKIHTGEKPQCRERLHKCCQCDKWFLQASHLKRHMMAHTGEKRYTCFYCSRQFTEAFNLRTHIMTHTGEKPHSCSYCGKRFAQPGSLKSHIRTHTGEKPYGCSHCGKWFSMSCDLKKHIMTHTGDKPYKCPHCTKQFIRPNQLKIHTAVMHRQEKPLYCSGHG